MAFFSDYVAYFKHQAEAHPDLLHSDTAGQRVFAVIDQAAASGDFRAGAKDKGFILRLVEPVGGAEGDAQPLVSVLGGFIIARVHSQRVLGDTDQTSAMDDSWRVGMDIAAKVLNDSQNGHPLWNYSVNTPAMLSLNWQPRLNAGDVAYAGWLFTFRWKLPMAVCVGVPGAPDWTDGGLTPY